MTAQFQIGQFVRVQSQSIAGGKELDAIVVGHHVSGYYIGLLGREEERLYVTHDEVRAIEEPLKPSFKPGSDARLGGPDGPHVTVIAVFSRGFLIWVHGRMDMEIPNHVMEVPASDLFETVKPTSQQVFVGAASS